MDKSELQHLTVQALDLDELEFLFVQFKAMETDYQAANIVPPKWFKAKKAEVDYAYAERTRADKERKLAALEARYEQIKPIDEKRKTMQEEIAALRAELGKV